MRKNNFIGETMKKILKSLIPVFVLALLCVLTVSCKKDTISAENFGDDGYILDGENQLKPDSIIKINGISVPFQEYRYYYLNMKEQMSDSQLKYWEENPQYVSVLKDNVLDILVELYSIRALCSQAGISSDVEQVWDTLEEFRDSLGKDDFKTGLQLHYLTEDLYAYYLEGWQLYDKLYEHYFGDSGVSLMSDAEILKYVNENYYHIEHIYLQTKTQYREDELEDVLKTALEKAENAEDFSSLLSEYGVDDSIPEYICRADESYAEFVSECDGLEQNEVSGCIETADGTYILKLLPVDVADLDTLRETVYNRMYSDLIENKIASSDIETTPEYDLVAPDTLK